MRMAKDYVVKRIADGKSKKEILRHFKHYGVREICRVLTKLKFNAAHHRPATSAHCAWPDDDESCDGYLCLAHNDLVNRPWANA